MANIVGRSSLHLAKSSCNRTRAAQYTGGTSQNCEGLRPGLSSIARPAIRTAIARPIPDMAPDTITRSVFPLLISTLFL